MTVVEALENLLGEIEDLVAESGVECEIDLYRVTAGLPAAPAGSCSAVSVWSSSYFNAHNSMFQEESPCLVVRGVQLNWRVDLCFSETEQDRSAAEHLEVAECLYGLADAIWCGIIRNIGDGRWGRCADVQIDQLTVNEASGGSVSAESGLRIQLDCTLPPES